MMNRIAFSLISRRALIWQLFASEYVAPVLLRGAPLLAQQASTKGKSVEELLWVCPMHPDYISPTAGACPLCGMTLVLSRAFDVRDYNITMRTVPEIVKAGQQIDIQLTLYPPDSDRPATSFYWVHTKQWHLFVISQDMEFFEHIHPVMSREGTWSIKTTLPKPGYYQVISDCFPKNGSAQLLGRPLVTAGYRGDLLTDSARLVPDSSPVTKTLHDMTAEVTFDPPEPKAGNLCRITYHLTDSKTGKPITDLQTYLGAFGHALMISEDMVDYVHVHPLNIVMGSQEDGAPPIFIIPPDADLEHLRGGPSVTIEAMIPKPGNFRVWMQMQRHDEVHTFGVNFAAVES